MCLRLLPHLTACYNVISAPGRIGLVISQVPVFVVLRQPFTFLTFIHPHLSRVSSILMAKMCVLIHVCKWLHAYTQNTLQSLSRNDFVTTARQGVMNCSALVAS